MTQCIFHFPDFLMKYMMVHVAIFRICFDTINGLKTPKASVTHSRFLPPVELRFIPI